MQRYTVYLYQETALRVSGGISTHHQEHTQVYIQRGTCQTVTANCRHRGRVGMIAAVVCVPDDGWRYHPKHVEQFPDINKLCNIASCWIYIGIQDENIMGCL